MAGQQISDALQQKGCNILETLYNLVYLAELEADDPGKVRKYLSLSKERLQAMTQMLVNRE